MAGHSNYGRGNTMQQELTPSRLAGFPSLLRKLFKPYLQHMAFLFLSLFQVANVLPQQYSDARKTTKQTFGRVCTMKRIYLGSRSFRLGSFRVPSAIECSILPLKKAPDDHNNIRRYRMNLNSVRRTPSCTKIVWVSI